VVKTEETRCGRAGTNNVGFALVGDLMRRVAGADLCGLWVIYMLGLQTVGLLAWNTGIPVGNFTVGKSFLQILPFFRLYPKYWWQKGKIG
jgi:hypothetical protein